MASRPASAPARSAAPDLAAWTRQIPAGGPPWLQLLRRSAAERFQVLGFPTVREEEWRQTDVGPLAATGFERAAEVSPAPSDLARRPFSEFGCPRLVLANGRFSPALSAGSLPADVRVGSLAALLRATPEDAQAYLGRLAAFEAHPFTALNTALFEDGVFVAVPAGRILDAPIHVLHVAVPSAAPTATHPRILVVAGDGASATIVESFVTLGSGRMLTNAVAEIVVGEDAAVAHVRIQDESAEGWHIGRVQGRVSRSGRLRSMNASLGGGLTRNDIGSLLDGEGGECALNGLYLGDGSRLVDNHTTIDHARPRCASHEMYQGVLAGSSRAVFNGRIVVRPGAQKTDAKQSNRNLLLSADALVHTRPQLEIYADDVKCTHGATIGHLDPDALFYLRSRAIGREEARNLLIRAFTAETISGVECEPARRALETETARRLELEAGKGAGR